MKKIEGKREEKIGIVEHMDMWRGTLSCISVDKKQWIARHVT